MLTFLSTYTHCTDSYTDEQQIIKNNVQGNSLRLASRPFKAGAKRIACINGIFVLWYLAYEILRRLFLNIQTADAIKLSSTIGPIDAGIVPLLAKTYEERAGIKVAFEGAGTGATLEKAKSGNFDMVIVHARSLEEKFIAQGFGIDRRDLMYNDFVILGPDNDPAGIRGMKDASAAFAKIASAKTLFVTRGDMSGTHVKELEVWDATGARPDSDADTWYVTFAEGNRGNVRTTLYANSVNAYLLMDRATCITQRSTIKLVPLVERDPILLNFIASIQVNPKRFPNINADSAKAFIDWMCSDEAQTIIRDFGVQEYGEPLFFPNSSEWKKTRESFA